MHLQQKYEKHVCSILEMHQLLWWQHDSKVFPDMTARDTHQIRADFLSVSQRDHRTQNIIMIKRDTLKSPKTALQQNSTLDGKMLLDLRIVYVQLLFGQTPLWSKDHFSLVNLSQQNPTNALCNRSTERNSLFGVKYLPLNHKSLKNFSLWQNFHWYIKISVIHVRNIRLWINL